MTFRIVVQPSGRRFTAEEGETILAAGIRQGVALPYGCQEGACGTCRCRKVEGRVRHGPHQAKALSFEDESEDRILTCSAVALSDLVLESRQVTLASAIPVRKLVSRVSALERCSPDVMLLRLQLPADDPFTYRPGQYVEFLLKDRVRRSYSIANAPHVDSGRIELHIRHMPGGRFTTHVFGAMKEKEIQRVEGPYGSFYLREDSDRPIVMLASGTGFAPIKALIEHMQFHNIVRPVSLYWGGRRPQDIYMDGWVRQKLVEIPTLVFVPVVSNATPEDGWEGRTGFVHVAVLEDLPDLSGHQVYACGAPVMVDAAREDFRRLAALPEGEFFADSFITEADKANGGFA